MGLDRTRSALALLVLLLVAGCTNTEPTSLDATEHTEWSAPAIRGNAAQSWDTFYPLAIENKWRYERTTTVQFIVDGVPEPPETMNFIEEFEHICKEINGREYIVEARRWYDAAGDSGAQHVRYRQDLTGLYEADMCLCDPPECVAGGSVVDLSPYDRMWERLAPHFRDDATRAAVKVFWDNLAVQLEASKRLSMGSPPAATSGVPELTRLRYPLYPGQNWAIRTDGGSFTFKAGVEAFEVVDFPVGQVPAYRVRTVPPIILLPGEVLDFVTWWGRCGFMGADLHFELEVFNPGGKTMFVIGDDIQKVTSIDIQDLRPCTIATK